MANKSTLKMSDIARLAGVSESTVSRALADNPLINVETRKRIQALAQKHNYSINRQARNLRLQSSQTVSIIIPVDHEPKQYVSDPFFLDLFGAIADALTLADYDLLLSRVHTSDWRKRVASHSYVDGLVVIGQSDLHEDINDFAKNNSLPLVVWGGELPGQKYTSIGCDNLLGGCLATQHLIENGRNQIMFLGDPALPEVGLRHGGYRKALESAGLPYDPSLVFPSGFARESGEKAMEGVMQSGVQFDSVFAASDVLASIAIKHLTFRGQKVPQDISVVGFDDISLARYMSPPLTTVSQTIYQAGQVLVDNLFRQIGGEKTHSEMLPPKLVVRSTSVV